MIRGRKLSVLAGDIAVIAASFLITFIIRGGGQLPPHFADTYLVPFVFLYFFWIVILYMFNLYDSHLIKPNFQSIRQIILALITQAVVGFLMFYFIPYFGITPKTTMLLNSLIFGMLFIGWRTLFYRLVAFRFQKSMVIIGTSDETRLLIEHIEKSPHMGYRYIGNFATVQEMSAQELVPELIVLGRALSQDELLLLSKHDAEIERISPVFQKMFFKIPVALVSEESAAKNIERQEVASYKISRRIVEFVFALIVIGITLPISIITAVCIVLEDGGPIFYTQERIGKKKKHFTIIKFRSMKKNAEVDGAQWATKQDPRITHVGRIIRKLHIDEIPQMVNILRGDLALVGPRAERPEFVEQLESTIPYYFLRHVIKPGFTGWAQIKFRYARTVLDSKEKFEYDLFYIQNRNFFLDLGIIAKTAQIIFTH